VIPIFPFWYGCTNIYIKLITRGPISHIQFILIYIQPLSLLSEMNLRGLGGAMTHSLYNKKKKKWKKKKLLRKRTFIIFRVFLRKLHYDAFLQKKKNNNNQCNLAPPKSKFLVSSLSHHPSCFLLFWCVSIQTWYLSLYNFTAAPWARSKWWVTM
jgi:hypothetical protein